MTPPAPRKLWQSMRQRVLGSVILGLFAASVFFTIEVERTRRTLRQTGSGAFHTADVVKVLAVIDGDEISVADAAGNRTVVRLLGVKSFEPGRNDPVTQRYGQLAFEHLKRLVGTPVKITVNDPPRDSKKRLLAFLDVEGTEAQDIGLRMIEQGLAMAYTEYPHAREESYVTAEVRATRKREGLWGDPQVVQRAQALKALWLDRRNR